MRFDARSLSPPRACHGRFPIFPQLSPALAAPEAPAMSQNVPECLTFGHFYLLIIYTRSLPHRHFPMAWGLGVALNGRRSGGPRFVSAIHFGTDPSN